MDSLLNIINRQRLRSEEHESLWAQLVHQSLSSQFLGYNSHLYSAEDSYGKDIQPGEGNI